MVKEKEWRELSSEERCAIRFEILERPKIEHAKACKKKPIAYRRAKVDKCNKLIKDAMKKGDTKLAEAYNEYRDFWVDTLPKKEKVEKAEDLEVLVEELIIEEEDLEIEVGPDELEF